ncbi:MAG: ABC transporter permease [Bacteroidales bacterium]|nr:ABC transporter permease [Bacteroidales bacterium]
MNELFLVIHREYIIRVRTISFVLTTVLTPILLSLVVLLPVYFVTKQTDYKPITIGLIDPVQYLKNAFTDSEFVVEPLKNETSDEVKQLVLSDKYEGIIYLNRSDSTFTKIQYYFTKQPSISLIGQIKSAVEKVAIKEKMTTYGINDVDTIINAIKKTVDIELFKVGDDGIQNVGGLIKPLLSIILGLIIYMFVFMFSIRVMRGVLEEKGGRIVELIITSISPVKFMTGKIIGIAMVGLTQIVCWFIIFSVMGVFLPTTSNISSDYPGNFIAQQATSGNINQILININQLDINTVAFSFVFFFIGGYLLYSSIFAAIAAAAKNEEEVGMFSMIITIPLLMAIIVLSSVIISPDSSLSYWFSIIPFTSPVVMMGRIVYGAPMQDILLSMFLLIVTAGTVIWLSGKIYKMKILYAGKKVTMREIISWIKNANK